MPRTRRRVVRGVIIGAVAGYILWCIAFGATAFAFRDAPDPPSNLETLRLVALASLVYGAFGGAFYGGLIGAVAGFVGDVRAGRGGAV
jgi:hypothetical protein